MQPLALADSVSSSSIKRGHESGGEDEPAELENNELSCPDTVYIQRYPKKARKTKQVSPESPTQTDESFTSVELKSTKNEIPKTIPKRPPPIVLHNVAAEKVDDTTRQVISTAGGRASFRCGSKSITIITTNKEDWTKVKEDLDKANDLEYHTYTHPDEKRLAYVMRGAHSSLNPEEIQLTLKEKHGIEAKVSVMTFRRKISESSSMNVPMPLFQVIIDKDTPIEKLISIREMSHYRVTWEKKRGRAQVTQCRNCQRFGHTATNCGCYYRCVKCKENHEPGKCGNSVELKKPAECVNCGEQHPANYSKCQVRQRFISKTNPRNPGPARIPSGLGLRREGISYASITSSNPLNSQPSPAPQNSVNRLLDECEELFGTNLFDLKVKCDQFFTEYDRIPKSNIIEKRFAYMRFVASLPTTHD